MGKKKTPKISGAERTAAKTEKNNLKRERRLNKVLNFNTEVSKQIEEAILTSRVNCTFTSCVNELYLFGGEVYDGSKTIMTDNLLAYNIKNDQWISLDSSLTKPSPRSSHQTVYVASAGGQLWVFGGGSEGTKFQHYNDLWMYSLKDAVWTQVKRINAPSPRSGHRMVLFKRHLLVFGGFFDCSESDEVTYFNDAYLFSLDTYEWRQIEPVGVVPNARSGCQMCVALNAKIVVVGGYSRKRGIDGNDRGIIHTDMFHLVPDTLSNLFDAEWRWVEVKQTGSVPTPRIGLAMVQTSPNRALLFGGVFDDEEDDDDDMASTCYDDLFQLELDKGRWNRIIVSLKPRNAPNELKRRHEPDEEELVGQEDVELVGLSLNPESCSSSTANSKAPLFTSSMKSDSDTERPFARRNAMMCVLGSRLYLYGGVYEHLDQTATLNDFYSIDWHRLDRWQVLRRFDLAKSLIGTEVSSDSDDSESDNSD